MAALVPQTQTRLTPWPQRVQRAKDLELLVGLRISTPDGWLSLEDGDHYAVHGEALAERTQSYRKQDVNSPWVEGSFTVHAVRENVTEPLSVWVRGEGQFDFRQRLRLVQAAFEQQSYRVMVRLDDAAEYWDCPSPADYVTNTQREFLHATIGVVRASVIRLPATELVVAADEER